MRCDDKYCGTVAKITDKTTRPWMYYCEKHKPQHSPVDSVMEAVAIYDVLAKLRKVDPIEHVKRAAKPKAEHSPTLDSEKRSLVTINKCTCFPTSKGHHINCFVVKACNSFHEMEAQIAKLSYAHEANEKKIQALRIACYMAMKTFEANDMETFGDEPNHAYVELRAALKLAEGS